MPRWTSHVVLVTGGSQGLGREIAGEFAKKAATVVIVGRDEGRLRAAAVGLGESVTPIQADVTRDDDVARLIDEVVRRHGRLDVLVNCVGRSARGALASLSLEELNALWEMNVLSAVRVTQTALPHLVKSRGHIVNIGSLAAKAASRFLGGYALTKFPLAAFSQQLRLELAADGVHVLLVCPGPIAREDAGRRYDEQAAGLPDSVRKPGAGVKLKGLDPQYVARRIVAACERRQPELVIPWRARLLFAISQLSPRWGDWLLGKMTS